ncbi:hypothetical protein Lbir_0013 [Legionella birminghamensis]|uniref:Uncharacterized protein n=1 Tax=Legionella birminghamensis TaxID=28083 RepID=A0A378IB92_9GAMM|nr:hypothetical protein [Legionella birminghamensis]KTC75944.1 hypothetical protein Lbir_0013 [Legionella birminghamensis]STX32070.1 Uncharacterised protein [Legionella birminghamensis]
MKQKVENPIHSTNRFFLPGKIFFPHCFEKEQINGNNYYVLRVSTAGSLKTYFNRMVQMHTRLPESLVYFEYYSKYIAKKRGFGEKAILFISEAEGNLLANRLSELEKNKPVITLDSEMPAIVKHCVRLLGFTQFFKEDLFCEKIDEILQDKQLVDVDKILGIVMAELNPKFFCPGQKKDKGFSRWQGILDSYFEHLSLLKQPPAKKRRIEIKEKPEAPILEIEEFLSETIDISQHEDGLEPVLENNSPATVNELLVFQDTDYFDEQYLFNSFVP